MSKEHVFNPNTNCCNHCGADAEDELLAPTMCGEHAGKTQCSECDEPAVDGQTLCEECLEIQMLKDEKRGLYPDKTDIAN